MSTLESQSINRDAQLDSVSSLHIRLTSVVHSNGASVSIRTSPSVPSTSSALLVLISRPISIDPPVRFHRSPLVRTFFAAPHTGIRPHVGPSCAVSGTIATRVRAGTTNAIECRPMSTTCASPNSCAALTLDIVWSNLPPSAPTANILCSMSQPFPAITLPRPFPVPCDTLHAESTMCVTALCRSVLSWSALRSTHRAPASR
mmetsp:Transcript_8/g.51  ORF Transcript_8/g.51 Transcript_8/m.51 type:complete len:202 (-) Transcript_8:545-1150(-)